jgi:hypothetical protein
MLENIQSLNAIKPMIIYAMPRTRSTVVLECSRRKHHLGEPFSPDVLFSKDALAAILLPSQYYSQISVDTWMELQNRMDNSDTATKLLPSDIYYLKHSWKWWKDINEFNTHDIFVLERDWMEVSLSLMIARMRGYNKKEELFKSPVPRIHTTHDMSILYDNFDKYLRYYPTVGTVITWEDLPTTHFDKSQIHMQEQNSLEHLYLIENLEWVQDRIREMIEYFNDDWQEKRNKLVHFKSGQ